MKEVEKHQLRKGALGKGIGSLLRDIELDRTMPTTKQAEELGLLKFVPLQSIQINPRQPRKFFNEDKLQELAASIKNDGILQPLVVKPTQTDRYLLIAGERRLRASKIAGLEEVPVIIKDIKNEDLLRVALIENIQRADLNVIEEAQAIKTLIDDLQLTQEDCAQKLSKDRSTIANTLRLLHLPSEIQDDLVGEKLTMGHARALLSLESKEDMIRARDVIIANNLNVRQTEQLCKKAGKEQTVLEDLDEPANPNLEYLADKIRNHLKTKVKLSGSGNRGKIVISYFSAAELERIIDLVSGIH